MRFGSPVRPAAVSAATLLLVPAAARACSVCYGDPDSPATRGMQMAIFFLLGLTGLVLAGFAAMFFYFSNRSRKHSAENSLIVQRMMEASKR